MSCSWVVDAEVPPSFGDAVGKGADCAVGHTTTAWPPSSGAKQSGIMVGQIAPTIAMPAASRAISRVVTTRTSRKLRKRTCSRSAAELAARTEVTIWPRS